MLTLQQAQTQKGRAPQEAALGAVGFSVNVARGNQWPKMILDPLHTNQAGMVRSEAQMKPLHPPCGETLQPDTKSRGWRERWVHLTILQNALPAGKDP